jgi:hypothetical protein
MGGKIVVNVHYYLTAGQIRQRNSDQLFAEARRQLVMELSQVLLSKPGIITETTMAWPPGELAGTKLEARCIVLTMDDFDRLVERIEKDVISRWPIRI